MVVYRDSFSDLFWWWLLTRSLDQQAQWAYHHRASMDEQRYRDLLASNAQLEAKVKELEAAKVRPDPTFTPSGLPAKDLMFRDEYVEAVYNPQPAPQTETTTEPAPENFDSGSGQRWWHGIRVLVIVGAVLSFLVWLVFFKRWGSFDRATPVTVHDRLARR